MNKTFTRSPNAKSHSSKKFPQTTVNSERRLKSPIQKSTSRSKIKSSSETPKKKFSHQEFITNIKSKRQKIKHSVDTHTLLLRSKNPIRCLRHNSNISLYCETQQKLLCANCIYGKNEHKFHKIFPVDKSYNEINYDIELMKRLIDKQKENISTFLEKLVDQFKSQEEKVHKYLAELVLKYQKCHLKLEDTFRLSKQKIISTFEKQRLRFQGVLVEMQILHETYQANTKISSINIQTQRSEENLLYQHVVCGQISKQKSFDENGCINSFHMVDTVGKDQILKIEAIEFALNKIQS